MRPLSIALALCVPALVRADAIDDYIQAQMKARHIPGVALAIVRDGKIVRETGYGLADIENQVRVTPNTVFQIGSVSKQFCATIVMRLVEQGKIGLDKPVRSYLPTLPALWKDATVRHLLTHTSGIANYTDVPGFIALATQPGTDAKLIELVAKQKLDFAPGTKFNYSNTGYYVLGMLVEKITGKSYAAALQEHICGPLGLAATRMNDWSVIVPNRARGYDPEATGPTNATYIDMKWPGAAGAIVSTAHDLAVWLIGQDSAKLLKPESWKAMESPMKLASGESSNYGFGWGIGSLVGAPTLSHEGGIPGFHSAVIRVPSRGISVVVLANALPAQAGELARKLVGLQEPSLAEKTEPIKDPTPELTKRLKGVLEQGLRGQLDRKEFDDRMAALLFPAHEHDLQKALGNSGPIKAFDLVEANDKDGVSSRVYRAQIGEASLTVRFVVNKQGKISGMLLGG